jgi:hypothetical protein
MTAYGFSLHIDQVSFQLNALKNILKKQQQEGGLGFPRFAALGLPSGPFTHLPAIDVLKQTEGFENVVIIGESVTHQRTSKTQPIRYIDAYPTPDITSKRDGVRIKKALDRAIHLEKEYISRFIEGVGKEDKKDQGDGFSSGNRFTGGEVEEEKEEEEELTYPLPFLPRHEDVSWGQLLAMHHDSQIEGPDQWEAAKERMILPLLNNALSQLSQHKVTKDWAVLYKLTCREMLSAFDEEHNYRRQLMAQQLSEYIDNHVHDISRRIMDGGSFSESVTPTLEARCVCLALARGVDVVLTEDWEKGGLYRTIIPGKNVPLMKDATKLVNTHIENTPLLR